MGTFLNRGIHEFESAVNSLIYVDKTDMVDYFNKLINTEQRYACISRPRRFGKTMAANMLAAYYEKGSDARRLFENQKLGCLPNWDKNLNKYDVIRIDIADINSVQGSPEAALDYIEKVLVEELDEAYPDLLDENCMAIVDALDRINQRTGAQFVIIIDEWDAFFRDEKYDKEIEKRYVNLLRGLFKGNRSRNYIALAYITGILPIKKYNSESALNNFREYTMLSPKKLKGYIGFNEDEVRTLCTDYNMDYEEICAWYDGYSFSGEEHVFGPNSVVQAMLDGNCENYWSQTVAFNSLATYITMNFDGLKDSIVKMMAGIPEKVDVFGYQNDMTSFKTKDDVMTLLIHLGYLCYDAKTETAYIPNKEVRQIFERSLRPMGWDEVIESIDASEKLMKALLKGDEETVARGVEECHRQNTSILKYNDENSLAMTLGLAFYSARKDYKIVREFPNGEGFADMVFIPKRNSEYKPVIVVELKWNKAAETAITQIKNRKYFETLDCISSNKEIILVGISYEKMGGSDENYKKHHCTIEHMKI